MFEDILDMNVGGWYGYDNENDINDYLSPYLSPRIDLDLSEPDYSFDLLSFWVRKDTGQILYAQDAGCSCPSPYEDVKVSELVEISLDRIPYLLDELGADDHEMAYSRYSRSRLRKDFRDSVLPELVRLGGK